ncbi:MAG: hypothetical protein IT259_12825 [Saprospiraceae bacterium]|nr:hypothetical protein [Saprospiraceae bacterium]
MRLVFIGLLLLPALLHAQPFRLANMSATDVSCFGFTDGALQIGLIDGTAPATYQWVRLPNAPSGSGVLSSGSPVAAVADLSPGAYRVTVVDNLGRDTVLYAIIGEPSALEGSMAITGNFNQYDVSCANSADGELQAQVSGGTPFYTYNWSGNTENSPVADSLSAGPYSLTVTDSRGCSIEFSSTLEAPSPLQTAVEAIGEKCFGENTGAINLLDIQGGVPPYLTRLDAGPFGSQTSWANVPPGQHFLTVEDANGCRVTDAVILPLGFQFTFNAGPDTTLLTGDSLLLTLSADKPLDTVLWTPSATVLAPNPETAVLFPIFTTHYQLTAIDLNGCKALEELTVTVGRHRDIYAPNVFAPEGQTPENRGFTLFGGAGIRHIAVFQVFDRFGKLIYEQRELPLNDPAQGWLGDVNGESGPPGVYVWHAVVLFTDGREEIYQGDVLLMR